MRVTDVYKRSFDEILMGSSFGTAGSLWGRPRTDCRNGAIYGGFCDADTDLIRTTQGADGGQSVNNLKVKDQSGSQNSWTKYVEFQTPGKNYVGTRSYTLPAGVTPSALTGLQVEVNFLGPTKAAQAWHWRLYNFSSNSWDVLGDNSGSSWSAWKLLSFNASGTLKKLCQQLA